MSKGSSSPDAASNYLFGYVWFGAAAYLVIYIVIKAYQIRLMAIQEYGPVIHEFDPYFNYRATEYLYEHGAKKFFTWFDYMVWYPLGRPVGSTIYPGMQFTAVFLKNYVFGDMSLNDVCCYMPAWFGAVATCFTGLIAYECTLPTNKSSNLFRYVMDVIQGKPTYPDAAERRVLLGLTSPAVECAVATMAMMAIVPAHLMRSVGGGYDNESVAMTAMTATFYLWVRSLRNNDNYSYLYGILAGLAYFYMVAAWGGYVFVLNMVGVHAVALVLMGRFNDKIYAAYSLFYVVGTALAIQIPVVGWTPLKSLEQLGPCAVFLGYQALQFCEIIRKRQNLSRADAWKLRIQVAGAGVALLVVFAMFVAPAGYFGPISSRVRGLFVKHTKTGNPLVDSVAEHQAASSKAYFQYLHNVCTFAPIGYILVFFNLSEASSFLLVWGSACYFFSHKMVRLILLTAAPGTVCAGIAIGHIFAWCVRQVWDVEQTKSSGGTESVSTDEVPTATPVGANGKVAKSSDTKKKKKRTGATSKKGESSFEGFKQLKDAFGKAAESNEGIIIRRVLAVMILFSFYYLGNSFSRYCWELAGQLSNPTIIMKGRTREGDIIKVDDYREAYWWLRDNTPEDSRIMAWWDYGYQITAIANRTTIADGNTWNHEHIALLGKALTSPIDEGYEIARHMADYVLVWAGGGGDDLAKSPHLARIANSVYRDHCPGDPTCAAFGFVDRRGTPSPMMERSFLYRLHGSRLKPGVVVDPDKFQEVFRSKYGKVRIYKIVGASEESKRWVADPANRLCDVPGSWFCPGQYPPGLADILARKKDFAQLEDFNRGQSDEDYQKEYFEHLNDPSKAKKKAAEQNQRIAQENAESEPKSDDGSSKNFEELKKTRYRTYDDTEETTTMWRLVTTNAVDELKMWLDEDPSVAFLRSKDGRGPMWWAFESRNQDIVKLLMKAGVPHTDKDQSGRSPADLLEGNK